LQNETYWNKIQKHHTLCSIIHGLAGSAVAILIFDPLGRLSVISGLVGAFLIFTWFTIYEVIQWWTKRDSPTQEIGEAMIGFLCTTAVCVII